MKKIKSKTFVIKIEIIPISNQTEILEKHNKVAKQIYNCCLNEIMKRYRKLCYDLEYQSLQEKYKNAKKKNLSLDELKKEYSKLDQKYGLTEYSLHDFVKIIKNHFNLLGSHECQKLATRAFNAYKKVRYNNAKKVNFKKYDEDIFIEGKSHTSSCHYKDNYIYLGRKNKFKLKEPDDYQKEALKNNIKYSGIKPETIRGKKRWFAYIILEGIPPLKRNYNESQDKTGLDFGVSTIAIASNKEVNIYDLDQNLIKNYKKIRILQRAMDRSRRASNPNNYNENGTCKSRKQLKEIHPKGKLWYYTKRYEKLKALFKEIHRHTKEIKKQHHEKLANHIISLGNQIYTEKINFQSWAKRSEQTIINPKTGRPYSKKRFGKAIANGSPGMLLEKIKQKLSYIDKKVIEYNTNKIKASQYNHITDSYIKKKLKLRLYEINNIILQRDMYSAFISKHVNDDLETINKEAMKNEFDNYLKLQNESINKLKNTSLRWYVS